MYKNKISAVYQIINEVTGDRYVGSSKNVKRRWADHKCPSKWKRYSNRPLYRDMQKYGVDKFRFQILTQVTPEHLKEVEQEFIEALEPEYNNHSAKGLDVERQKEWHKKYRQTDKGKETRKKYRQSEKGKEAHKKYNNQLCSYNGETLKLSALCMRFKRAGVENPTKEAKKYLLQ